MVADSSPASNSIFNVMNSIGWSASTRIYNHLRQRILSLDLPPGTSLLRSELAQNYNVSVTPIRDALRILEQDGLVKVFPQSRTLVTCINEPLIHEALFLRKALETEVVKQLSRECPAETLIKAKESVEAQIAIVQKNGQLRLFQEIDEQFHQILFEGSGQGNLHELIRSKAGHLDRVRRLQKHSQEKLNQIIQGHIAVIEALEAGNEAVAVASMRDHLWKPQNWVSEFRSKHPDYFD